MSTKNSKLTLMGLILMIFTSVYGFTNMPISFMMMGYSAIPYYIFSALVFFIPYAYMVSEYGAAFQHERGGIFSWMEKSVGLKYSFVGTFMWYASYVIWLVSTSSKFMIPLSNAMFGTDTTQSWHILGLHGTQVIGVFAAITVLIITFFSVKGLHSVAKVAKIGGISCMSLNIVLIIGALVVFFGNGGQLQQPISSASDLMLSPNVAQRGLVPMVAFVVYALFAFGGVEAVGGLVDETENPQENFGKGISLSAIIIAIGYSIGIFCIGMFTNLQGVLGADSVNKGNVSYVVMNNLGFQVAKVFGADAAVSKTVGDYLARFVGLSIMLSYIGAMFTLIYSPLKQLIVGSPKGLLPTRFAKLNNKGIPANAMWMQCTVVVILDLLIAFGGNSAKAFFDILTNMANVSITIPYMFIAGAFISFKRKTEIKKPLVIYKKKSTVVFFTYVILVVIGLANLFTIIQPALNGDIPSMLYTILGPVLFSSIALTLVKRYEQANKK